MDTVTATEPAFGSLDFFLGVFRRGGWLDEVGRFDELIVGQIEVIANPKYLTPNAVRVERIRNVLAAAAQVRTERAAR